MIRTSWSISTPDPAANGGVFYLRETAAHFRSSTLVWFSTSSEILRIFNPARW
jgi:hypothetical protein